MKWNPADNPSRGKWSPSEPVQFFGDGFVSATSIGDPSRWTSHKPLSRRVGNSQGLKATTVQPPRQQHLLMPHLEMQIDRSKVSRSVKKMNRQKLRAGVVVQQKGRTVLEEASVSERVPYSIYSALGLDQTQDSRPTGKAEVHEDGGQCFGETPGTHVSRWGRYQFSPICNSLGTALCAKPAKQTERQSTKSEAVVEGVELTITPSKSASSALGSCLHVGDGEFQIGGAPFWPSYPSHVLPIPAANGMPEIESLRLSPAKSEGQRAVPVVVSGPTSSRGRDPIEDHGVRRGLESRPRLPSEFGVGASEVFRQNGDSSGTEDFHTYQHGPQQVSEPSNFNIEATGNWSDPPIQVSTRGSLSRLSCKAQRAQCYSVARGVGKA